MKVLESVDHARFAELLAQREAELRRTLAAPSAEPDAHREVLDFKDMAVEETLATVDEAKAGHASEELNQVLAARRRMHEGTYGECVDCGEEIDPRRLAALPFTPFCTACQSLHEYRRATPPPAPPPLMQRAGHRR
jgi:DnaK suppressor protein